MSSVLSIEIFRLKRDKGGQRWYGARGATKHYRTTYKLSTVEDQLLLTCWICGAVADSAEHRIKKTDLVRVFGRGPYKAPFAPVRERQGILTPIQGPGSAVVKYAPSLCHRCNTTGTQAYDKAYDSFIVWLFANEEAVLHKRIIDFKEVYGNNFEDSQRDLFKYFVKSFGCRLISARQSVPSDLVALLALEIFYTALKITFCVNEDFMLLPVSTRSSYIGKGDLTGFVASEAPSVLQGYAWDENISWFTVCYWYGVQPEGGTGSTWVADTQHVYLGSLSPLSPEQRADVIKAFSEDPQEAQSHEVADS
jgi:hypothetical protein